LKKQKFNGVVFFAFTKMNIHNNAILIKKYILYFLIIAFVGCKKEEPIIPIQPAEQINDICFGIDTLNSIIIYNASSLKVIDGKINLCGNLKNKFSNNYQLLVKNGVYYRESIVANLTNNYSTTEIDYIKSWIDKRVAFLDTYFQNL